MRKMEYDNTDEGASRGGGQFEEIQAFDDNELMK
jgi:hypothetical protein